MTPALEIRGLGKAFGGRHALRDVSLDVGADELVVVLGPAGAGKTTLLRSIAGLEQPEEGAIRLDGRDVSGVPPADRDVALVFQDFSLYPDWRVATNLAFPLRAPGRALPGRELSERVQWAAALLHITPLLGRPSHLLSGGEQQRVAIGRALVRRPKLFLLDEPLTNLDAKLRERLRAEIAALRRDLRVPMLYVTHDQAEALSMADRLVVLGEGRILQVGSPEDVYRRPISPAVARQLGTPPINLIPARRRADRWITDAGVPVMAAEPGGPDEVVLGARPEDVIAEGGEHPATVRMAEFLGATKLVAADWAGGALRLLVPPDSPIHAGVTIRPRLDPERTLCWPVI